MVTPDGRYLVVRGMLWRMTSPLLSPEERSAQTAALMRARREVGGALRRGDEKEERAARRRVHRAKVALGERGPVWWTDGTPDYNRRLAVNTPYREWYQRSIRWEEIILSMLEERDPAASICPSEIARRVSPKGWRGQMEEVRDAARRLARSGKVAITQQGRARDPDSDFRGPVRISRPR